MNKNSIKSLVLGFIALFTAFAANAGDGTSSGNSYKVCGASGFKLTSSVTAPTGGTYQWFNSTGGAIASQTGNALSISAVNPTSVKDTSFRVVVYNAQGCPSDTGVIYVTLVPKPVDSAFADNENYCSNQAGGETLNLSASLNPASGSLPSGVAYSYAWTGSTGTGTISTPSALNASTTPPTAAGAYTYTLTVNYTGLDVNGSGNTACQSTDGVTINVSQSPNKPASSIEAL